MKRFLVSLSIGLLTLLVIAPTTIDLSKLPPQLPQLTNWVAIVTTTNTGLSRLSRISDFKTLVNTWSSNSAFIVPKGSSAFQMRLSDGSLFIGGNATKETDINNTNSISPLYQVSMTDSNEPASANLQFGVVDSHAHKFVAQSLWDHYASSNGSLVLLKLHAHDRTNSSEIGFISDSTGPAFYVRSNFVNLFAVSQNALSINGVDYVPPNSQGSAGSMLSDVSGSGILFWSQDASSLTNITLNISGSNAIAPADLSTIRAWVNVTLPNGAVFKMPLYQ